MPELPSKPTLEEIVDEYVQRARSSHRPTEYDRSRSSGLTLHHIVENDEFRILDHVIAVKDRRIEWIWRSQDFWPTDQLTDITISRADLLTFGVIHGNDRISGVKFTVGPRRYAGPDPDACLPYVNDFLHLEAHYRWQDEEMRLQRARIGVDFITKDGLTLRARNVEVQLARFTNREFTYRSSLGSRLLVNVGGDDELRIDAPTRLLGDEVRSIFDTVSAYRDGGTSPQLPKMFSVARD